MLETYVKRVKKIKFKIEKNYVKIYYKNCFDFYNIPLFNIYKLCNDSISSAICHKMYIFN